MKIRNGFVSNSSSSSFIVSEEAYGNCKDDYKKLIDTLFIKRKAQDVALDYGYNSLEEFYDFTEETSKLVDYCRNDANIFYLEIDRDKGTILKTVLSTLNINYSWEEC